MQTSPTNVKQGGPMEVFNQRYFERIKFKELSCLWMYEGRGLEKKLKRLEETDRIIDKERNTYD